jgi:ATP-dependent exoDNAse (exonuclease V) beta subunit
MKSSLKAYLPEPSAFSSTDNTPFSSQNSSAYTSPEVTPQASPKKESSRPRVSLRAHGAVQSIFNAHFEIINVHKKNKATHNKPQKKETTLGIELPAIKPSLSPEKTSSSSSSASSSLDSEKTTPEEESSDSEKTTPKEESSDSEKTTPTKKPVKTKKKEAKPRAFRRLGFEDYPYTFTSMNPLGILPYPPN